MQLPSPVVMATRLTLQILWVTFVCCLTTSSPVLHRNRTRALLEKIMQEFEQLENELHEGGKYADQAEATTWMSNFNKEARKRTHDLEIINWKYLTDINAENSRKLEETTVNYTKWMKKQQGEAKLFYANQELFYDETLKRMLKLLVTSGVDPVLDDEAKLREMSELSTKLTTAYSSATVEHEGKSLSMDPALTDVMATSRDPDELLWAWKGWRNATGPKMKDTYARFIELQNEGARDNGYADMGAYWRESAYETDNVENITRELYDRIAPLYKELHAYVRTKLRQRYPKAGIKPNGPIPAHLLGDMWAQSWQNIIDIVLPYPDVNSFDVTQEMLRKGFTPREMFDTAEKFFISIGLEPMTKVFWKESLIERPKDDRIVECHGSAEDFYTEDDFRIKMCTVVTQQDLQTVHHEMGHIQYFMAYRHQPYIFRTGANAAFHEAVGDTIALSVMTPDHLERIGLLNLSRDHNGDLQYRRDINFLLKMALEKVAFLPFGYLMDLWRWGVFKGEITPENYNQKWWEFRKQYQGIEPPVERTEDDFDPGSKFHIPSNVPYIRYFFSFIEQFQIHNALCNKKSHRGQIHHCDIYQSRTAGTLLKDMLKLGSSEPWPVAMEMLTGHDRFDASAIIDYFRPLTQWLEIQNNDAIGWE